MPESRSAKLWCVQRFTPLYAAVLKNNTEMVTMLLESDTGKKMDLNIVIVSAGHCGFFISLFPSYLVSIVLCCAQKGSGYSALMIASGSGYIDIVNLLLEYGANPNIEDPWVRSRLSGACGSHTCSDDF